jgi:flagellar basal body-associated protein FliL
VATPTSGATRAASVGLGQATRAVAGRGQTAAPGRALPGADGQAVRSPNGGGRGRPQGDKERAPKQDKKPMPLLLVVVALLTIIPIGLGSYVVFGPDTMWKPVYVRVEMDDPTPAAETAEPAAAAAAAAPAAAAPAAAAPGAAAEAHVQAPLPTLPQATLPQAQAVPATSVPQPVYPGPGVMYQMGTKVVNLADPGGLRYLQTSIVLEFHPSAEQYLLALDQPQAPAEDGGEEGGGGGDGLTSAVDARRPIIDDVVMTTLSSKRFNEISTVKGKQSLKEELIAATNQALGVPVVINLYFTEFVIQ